MQHGRIIFPWSATLAKVDTAMFSIGDTQRTGRTPCETQDAWCGIAFNLYLHHVKIIYMPQSCWQFCSLRDRRQIGS